MKGDFTRMTFDPTKHYSRVLEQQGRVQVDSDFNEMNEIHRYFLRRLAADLIGPHGGPGDSFKIGFPGASEVTPKGLRLSGGHYYVDGILCESYGDSSVLGPEGFAIPGDDKLEKDGSYFLYLDVWERHVTDIEDEDPDKIGIREVALRGPDTATRSQIVWQVRCRKAADANPDDDFTDFIDRRNKLGKGLGLGSLRARAIRPTTADEPCLISPEARYRGAENQLYRVEIHHPGIAIPEGENTKPDPAKVATFKWSRENGSVIFPITKRHGEVVELRHLGREKRFGLSPDDWVEIVDDDYTLQNRAEPLLQVKEVDRDNMRVTLKKAPPSNSKVGTDPEKHPLLRRWDHQSGGLKPGGPDDGAIPVVGTSTGDPDLQWVITLEDGVQTQFQAHPTLTYNTGDYWLIPARVATGDIDWPGMPGGPNWKLPDGIEHSYAPLAKISISQGKIKTADVKDLRRTIKQLVQ
jgi:hypothetical protein